MRAAAAQVSHETYDIFKRFPNGKTLWRESVQGREHAIERAKELLAASSPFECEFAVMHVATNATVAVLKAP